MFIFNIIGWCIFGLIVGAISRYIIPGKDPMSWLKTMLLGIGGSFAFGALFYVVFGSEEGGIVPAGFIGSVIGSALLLIGMRYMKSRDRNVEHSDRVHLEKEIA